MLNIGVISQKKLLFALFLFWGRVYDLCVYFMTGAPKAQPKVVLEKPGIKPSTPGLQGIALIHYTMAASNLHGTLIQILDCVTTWYRCLGGYKYYLQL